MVHGRGHGQRRRPALPTARWMRTASSRDAPLPPYSANGYQQGTGPPSSRNFCMRACSPGCSSSRSGDLAEVFVQPRKIAVQSVSLGAQQVHDPLPTGTATSGRDDLGAADLIRARSRTMLSISGCAPRSAPARRRGSGCPCRALAENMISLPCAASTPATSRRRRGSTSPSSWRNVMVRAPGSNESSSGPAQQAKPRKVVLPLRHGVRFSDTSVTATLWTASLSSWIPLEVGGKRLVHVARWFIGHV